MVQINFARREVNCKIVYYGPGLSGKTTNIESIHKKVPDNAKGQLTSIATEGDRTLFFDFLPLDIGEVAGMKTKFQLYTVPGQVYYNATRKLVLQGADGVILVCDSDPSRMEDNLESLKDLEENLKENGLAIQKVPFVIQFNKRDLPNALPLTELNQKLNPYGVPTFEAVAFKGEGVMPTLKALSKLVLNKLNEDYGRSEAPSSPKATEKISSTPPPPLPVKIATPTITPKIPEPKPPIPVEAKKPIPAPVFTATAPSIPIKREPPKAVPPPPKPRLRRSGGGNNKKVVILGLAALALIALVIAILIILSNK